MNRILVIIVLAFVFTTARAHNPNTCSVVFRPSNGVWMAQFTISHEVANVALNQFYKDQTRVWIMIDGGESKNSSSYIY